MSSANLAANLDMNALQRFLCWVSVVHPHAHAARIRIDNDQRKRLLISRTATAAKPEGAHQLLAPPLSLASDTSDAVDLPELLENADLAFVKRIRANLEQDRRDAADSGDALPSEPGIQACLSLAELVAPCVALAAKLKWAAFTEETGAVSLVLQSAVTDRRVNFCISADGTNASCIRIDEFMKSEQIDVRLDDANTVRELARWVARRA